jgi:hypothetical protein
MASLAQTTFSSGADDSLAVVDGYEQSSSSVVTNIPNLEELQQIEQSQDFVPDESVLDELRIIQGTNNEELQLDPEALKEGILSSSTGVMGAFKSLDPTTQKRLLETTGANKIKTTIDGVDKMITNGDYKSVKGIANMIKGISNCEFPIKILDLAGLIALATNLIKESSKLGVGDGYGAFINCLNNLAATSGITRNLVPYVSKNGDVDLLKAIADGPHRSEVKTYSPSFVKDFTKQFKLPPNIKQTAMAGLLGSTTSSFTKIDPEWNKKGSSVDASALADASDDFKKLIEADRAAKALDWNDVDYSDMDTSNQLSDNDKLFATIGIADQAKQNNVNLFSTPQQSLQDNFPLVA